MRIDANRANALCRSIGLHDASVFVPNDLAQRPRPSHFSWTTDVTAADVVVFTDDVLGAVDRSAARRRVAWLLEPPAIKPAPYDYIAANLHKFDLVFTFCDDLVKLDPRVRFYPHGTTWIRTEGRRVGSKTKNLSVIASAKAAVPGHRLRHQAVRALGDRMDVFGLGYRYIVDKTEGLAPYRYSLAIENSRIDTYFTEKIIDCFLTGVVPVYWGTSNVTSFFDPQGIIAFDSLEELGPIVDSLSPDDYDRRLPAVRRNFEFASRFLCIEDQLWERGLGDLFGR